MKHGYNLVTQIPDRFLRDNHIGCDGLFFAALRCDLVKPRLKTVNCCLQGIDAALHIYQFRCDRLDNGVISCIGIVTELYDVLGMIGITVVIGHGGL